MRYIGLVTAEVEEIFHVLWHSMIINEFLPGFCQLGSLFLTFANNMFFHFPFFAMILRVVSGCGVRFVIFVPLTFLP